MLICWPGNTPMRLILLPGSSDTVSNQPQGRSVRSMVWVLIWVDMGSSAKSGRGGATILLRAGRRGY